MRIQKKDVELQADFMKFMCKQQDFRYIEDSCAIFAPEKTIKGDLRIAIKIKLSGNIMIGTLDQKCNNFSSGSDSIYIEEEKWIFQCFEIAKGWIQLMNKLYYGQGDN